MVVLLLDLDFGVDVDQRASSRPGLWLKFGGFQTNRRTVGYARRKLQVERWTEAILDPKMFVQVYKASINPLETPKLHSRRLNLVVIDTIRLDSGFQVASAMSFSTCPASLEALVASTLLERKLAAGFSLFLRVSSALRPERQAGAD